MRYRFLLPLLMLAGCATRGPSTLERFEFTQPQMGLPFRIVLYAPDQAKADAAAAAAFRRIKDLNDTLSDYDTDSELSRLSQTSGQEKVVPVSDDLWRMLEQGQRLARETDGAFDITCGPVVSQWRKARREKKLPEPVKLQEALRAVGHDKLVLDPRRRTAELTVPYMRLDLGAIAKSYAVDEALRILRQRGIASALVAGAGDMAAGEAPPGREGWQIEIPPLDVPNAPPPVFVLLRNRALATSGDLFQHVEIDNVRYSHIVDPRTGIGLTDHSLVFAIARDCTTANTVATSVSVMGPEKGLRFAEKKNACVRIARQPGDAIQFYQSKCFERFLVPERAPAEK